jgi:hypothetical protein
LLRFLPLAELFAQVAGDEHVRDCMRSDICTKPDTWLKGDWTFNDDGETAIPVLAHFMP